MNAVCSSKMVWNKTIKRKPLREEKNFSIKRPAAHFCTPLRSYFFDNDSNLQIPVAPKSKVWVCGRSDAKNADLNPAEAWTSVPCKCCVLQGRDLRVGLITCPEESYRLWCVSDREASIMRSQCPTTRCCAKGEKWPVFGINVEIHWKI